VRELTGLDRIAAVRLVRRLAARGVVIEGRGRSARYRLTRDPGDGKGQDG